MAARRADRVAWVDYAEGKRNAYVASAPAFAPKRLTNFTKDDGIMMERIRISDDGNTVIFMRGAAPNRDGWSPNPTADPNGPEHAVWAAKTSGAAPAWRVVDASNPELAPDGGSILYVKAGQIYRTMLRQGVKADDKDKAFITEWGAQSDPEMVARRTQDRVREYAHGPQLHCGVRRRDESGEVHGRPAWISIPRRCGRRIASMWFSSGVPDCRSDSRRKPAAVELDCRRVQAGPQLAATAPGATPGAAAAAPGTGRGGRGGRGGVSAQTPGAPAASTASAQTPGAPAASTTAAQTPGAPAAPVNNSPGLMQATFKGGYTLSFFRGDALTGDAQEVWHNQKDDPIAANVANAQLAGDHVIFGQGFGGFGGRGGRGGRGGAAPPPAEGTPATPAKPVDEWDRYYSLKVTDADARPVLLTTTDGMIENQTSVALSADGKTFFYCTNAKRHRAPPHLVRPRSGRHRRRRLTTGEGVETSPAPLASGSKYVATLSASWNQPQSLGVWQSGTQKIVFPNIARPDSRKTYT